MAGRVQQPPVSQLPIGSGQCVGGLAAVQLPPRVEVVLGLKVDLLGEGGEVLQKAVDHGRW